MFKKYLLALSPYTIYVCTALKLFLWSLGMVLFGAKFEMSDMFSISNYAVTKYIMLGLSLFALAALKFKRYPMCLISAMAFLFIWMYTTLGFGISHEWYHSSNFLRNAVETLFIIYLCLTIHQSKKIVFGV